jgi:predicted nucleic acid-binding protein
MIVIDANILIYALIECDNSRLIPQLRAKDADWRTTELCRHETLNVLATYQRRGILTLEQCQELLNHANRFITHAQCEVNFAAALEIAAKHGISGYDAQYVALAASLSVPLISEDRKLQQAMPDVVISMQQFIDL